MIICMLDNKECDLDTQAKRCRHLKPHLQGRILVPGWTGRCDQRKWVKKHDMPRVRDRDAEGSVLLHLPEPELHGDSTNRSEDQCK